MQLLHEMVNKIVRDEKEELKERKKEQSLLRKQVYWRSYSSKRKLVAELDFQADAAKKRLKKEIIKRRAIIAELAMVEAEVHM